MGNDEHGGLLKRLLDDFRYWHIVLVVVVFAVVLAFFSSLPAPLNQRLVVGILLYLLSHSFVTEWQTLSLCRSGGGKLSLCHFRWFMFLKCALLIGLICFILWGGHITQSSSQSIHIDRVVVENVEGLPKQPVNQPD